MTHQQLADAAQEARHASLIAASPALGARFDTHALPFQLDLARGALTAAEVTTLRALEKLSARTAIRAAASLARAGDIDHLGGGLELIPALQMTLALVDYDRRHFTIEHGHTSIGYYGVLATLGFLDEARVVEGFRRSLDIAGHVSWVPGGTELSSGRLGVIVPVAVGQALGVKARAGADALVICHTGDAGWVSGQAMNGFFAAGLHRAPVVFVMHRNGIQLSGPTAKILDRDPRPIVKTLGVEILEVESLHDHAALFAAYAEGARLAAAGRPSLIYPTGRAGVTLAEFGERHGVTADVAHLTGKHGVALDTKVWVPGSLMSFRDAHPMVECLFYVNGLPGGEGHHDGGMKGRDEAAVLAHPLMTLTADEQQAIDTLRAAAPRRVVTEARPGKGAPNLVLTDAEAAAVALPGTDKPVSARAGSEAAYAAVAKKFPRQMFVVSCDLDPSTKLGKAASLLPADHRFELSIEEQVATLVVNGLAFSSRQPQVQVVSTFAAFMEGIAREGFEFWRYQRNLTGRNEGLNAIMHLAHVGACTGRDHFSGWSFDWINLALGYLPFLHRFYAPSDARSAFLAVRDAAANYGGHIVAIPRDTLPVLSRQGSAEPLWQAADTWTPTTVYRLQPGARVAILAVGAPAYLAGEASDAAAAQGIGCDVHIVNGFPLGADFMASVASRYRAVITIEDGLIGQPSAGLRGFAAFAAGHLGGHVALEHYGLGNPQVAPSETFVDVWKHFGMSAEALTESIIRLNA